MSKTNNKSPVKPWNMAVVSESVGEIVLYGDIEDYLPWYREEDELFITPKGFMDDLALVADKPIIKVRLNSGGGSLNTGIAIHNALKALAAKIVVVVEGLAASAASIIMCAGDEIQVYPGSMIMIHEPKAGINGGYYSVDDLEKGINMLEAGTSAAIAIYKEKTGLDEDLIREMMADETWMTGEQAIDKKFADVLITDNGVVSAQMQGSDFLMVAGVKHDVRNLRHLPDVPHIEQVDTVDSSETTDDKAPAAGGDLQKGDKTMEAKITNVADLRTSAPDLVKEIEAEAAAKAVAEERARLQAIDSIAATVADEKMLNEAKFGEHPMTAEQLALQVMQKQAALGATMAANIADDAKSSGVNDVTANADDEPINAASANGQDDNEKKMSEGAEAAKKMKF